MKKVSVIAFLLLSLSFMDGLGIGSCAFASYFEVQVPMSSSSRQEQMFDRKPLASGHFQTTVQSLDQNGCAYSPGQVASGPRKARKVEEDDHEDDPYIPGNVVPVGDTPWLLLILLLAVYVLRVSKRREFSY